MKIAIHQPQFMPYSGYIKKMMLADIFVLLDDVQFKKNEFQNRNRIKTPNGVIWLTVPVLHSFGQKINEVVINNNVNWKEKHIKTIKQNYSKSRYFAQFFPVILEIYEKKWNYLSELNTYIIIKLKELLEIKCELIMASSLNVNLKKTDRLIEIVKKAGGDVYISGEGAKAYIEEEKFKNHGIKLEFMDFKHPEYAQLYGSFTQNLSIIDMLFNEGISGTKKLLSD